MKAQLKALYQETADFFVYVHGYAPNIPNRGGLTLRSAIERLLDYLDTIDQSESEETVKRWLRLSWNEVKEAKKAFDQKEDREGRKRLESGRRYLQNAAERKPVKTTFVLGEPGFSE